MLNNQQIEKASFDLWLTGDGADNQTDIARLKRMVSVAMKECCTEKERCYITHFFSDRMTITEIAVTCGVNKSVVSRGIKRGLRRMHDHLKFCSPELYAAMPKQGRLRQKKIDRKSEKVIQTGIFPTKEDCL